MPRTTHEVDVSIDIEVPKMVRDFIIENEEAVARSMAAAAKASTAFKDKTGNLRRSIKAQKSRYQDGGWIVKADGRIAPHAHLIEYGSVRHSAKPFLRPAKEKVIDDAIRMFGVK